MFGHGRLPEATNDHFVDAEHEKPRPRHQAALERADRPLWVETCTSTIEEADIQLPHRAPTVA